MEPVREFRRRAGLTQSDLAKRLGCSKRQVESYDRGEKPLPIMVEMALCELERRLDLEYRAAARNCS